MGCEALSLDPDVAIRLADEGVPLRAIARAIRVSSEILRARLHEAQSAGRLLDLPRDDWPPGFPRDQRALQLSRMVTENRDQLLVAMQQLFNLPPAGTSLLLVLMQHPLLLKERIADTMTVRAVDVHIHHIRKRLTPYGIEIQTRWGHGYQFSPENRRRIMDLVLSRVST
jgi:DNA-binding response OmpR family regulator